MTDPCQDEELIDRLRQWLTEVREQERALFSDVVPGHQLSGHQLSDHERNGQPLNGELSHSQCEDRRALPMRPATQGLGVYQLVEEFTALRHELKLQTRSARGLEEQTETALGGLRQAIDAFQSIEADEAQAVWSAGKELASALADLDEALERGRMQLERIGHRLIEDPLAGLVTGLDALFLRQSWIRRWLIGDYHEQVCNLAQRQKADDRAALFAALLEGYRLVQNRLARVLADVGLVRITTVGKPVDPNLMLVLEVVESADVPTGEVVEEVRRGYTWNNRVLRCAEVRASRGLPG